MRNFKWTGALLMMLLGFGIQAQTYEVKSPDGALALAIKSADKVTFNVSLNGNTAISNAEIALDLGNGKVLGEDSKVKTSMNRSVNETISFAVPNKEKETSDVFNELTLQYKQGFSLVFRVYDDGVAYRWVTAQGGKSLEVHNEMLNLDFPQGSSSFFPKEESTYSHFEQSFKHKLLDSIAIGDFCAMPVRFEPKDGPAVLVTEADLYDYPCLFLEKTASGGFQTKFEHVVLETEMLKRRSDRVEVFTKQADYIASTSPKRAFPWRVFIISDDDRDFVSSNMVMKLSTPSKIKETDWIKPGKIAWDWYNANNIYGVDFESGINNDTYKYYIDFASEYGLEYVILDEGWTKTTTEVMESTPAIDIPELVAYAKSKNVNLILWLLWHPLDKNTEEILKLYSDWGVKGIKVDFMQRADQYMVNSYEKIARVAAENHLMVDFHGAFKPAGLRRAYPNVMTYEGVLGEENHKWSEDITPEHNTTLPFTRMVAGPMDYTPGAMANANPKNYAISWDRPMSLTTRCQQVALYMIYESPLQMLCDAPSAYYKEPVTTEFISKIPAVWDETRVLEGKIADYIMVARRNADSWYVGAITDENARELELDLSFLSSGSYTMTIMKDGVNVGKFAEDFKQETMSVDAQTKLKVPMASGGGWAAIITKK